MLLWCGLLCCFGSGPVRCSRPMRRIWLMSVRSLLTQALRDRLTLTPERVEAMAEGVEVVAALDDPVGEEIEHGTLASGIEMQKMRVPLGVVAVIYEAGRMSPLTARPSA